MKKAGFKIVTAVRMYGRRSGEHVDWTVLIAIFSTVVTLSLVGLYFWRN